MFLTSENKLLTKLHGPYQIKSKIGPVTYQIEIPSEITPLKKFHGNMLKKWHQQDSLGKTEEINDMAMLVRAVDYEEGVGKKFLQTYRSNSELNFQHLSEEQRHQLQECIPDQLFMDTPGRTVLVDHAIILKDPKPIQQPMYRVPDKCLSVMKQELQTLKQLGVIELGVIIQVSGTVP